MRQLTLYSRQGCHLCELLLEDLLPLIRGRALVAVTDIDHDQAFKQQFDTRVPVLCSGEEVVCEGRFDRQALISWLMRDDV